MAEVHSQFGRIEIFEDFLGRELPLALTEAVSNYGNLRQIGLGTADNDQGLVILESDGLSGIAQLQSSATAQDACGLATAKIFDVALCGPLVAECRVRMVDLDTKSFYFGFSSENDDAETEVCSGDTVTLTLTATSLCGFLFDHSLTEDEMWHAVFKGGTTTGITVSTTNQLGIDAVAGAFNILRVEVDPNGTARWYIDGVLKKTVEGAVSTTTDLAGLALVNSHGTAVELVELDYLYFSGFRDWTV